MNHVFALKREPRNTLELRLGSNPEQSVVAYHMRGDEQPACTVLTPVQVLELFHKEVGLADIPKDDSLLVLMSKNEVYMIEVLMPAHMAVSSQYCMRTKARNALDWESCRSLRFADLIAALAAFYPVHGTEEQG